MKKYIVLIVIVMTGLALKVAPVAAANAGDNIASALDFLHPKSFTSIYENDKYGRKRDIYTNKADSKNTSFYEVDIDSKIEIEFDRTFIRKYVPDFSISISGTVNGSQTGKKIEIPGYNVIGEKTYYSKKSFYEFSKTVDLLSSSQLDISKDLIFYNGDNNVDKQIQSYLKGEKPYTALDDNAKKIIKTVIKSKEDYLKSDLKTILKLDDDVLEFILINLITETRNTIPIKNLAQKVLDELEKGEDSSDINKALNNLTTISRYGEELKNNNSIIDTIFNKQLDDLKDTSILLSEIGAKEGDSLVIKIKNYEREFDIKLIIKGFGWKGAVTDSYFYVQRKGSGSQKFTPMQGVTLSQLYIPRRSCADLTDKCLFFTPGFGINVSFPQDKVNNSTQLSAGLVISLFNNAISLTYGADLTTEERAPYYGIGFSFANITAKITSITKN